MSWGPVRGHEEVLAKFRTVLGRGRLAHAYLFVGPDGIGKRLFAWTLAKALLCEGARDDGMTPCQHCPACLQVEARTHPDFQFAELPPDAHEFPVDAIQELIRGLAYKPVRGRKRIAIVNDADSFSDAASNSFLKTLEEPPPDSLLILIGASTDRFFSTITSRCQVIRFTPLPQPLVAELLLADGTVASPEEANRVAGLARGNMALAKALADPDVLQLRTELLDLMALPRLDGVALASKINGFAEEAKDSAEKRRRASLALGFVVEALRGALTLLTAGDGMEGVTAQASRALAQRVSEQSLVHAIDRCLEADRQIERRLQLVLVVEAAADTLSQKLR